MFQSIKGLVTQDQVDVAVVFLPGASLFREHCKLRQYKTIVLVQKANHIMLEQSLEEVICSIGTTVVTNKLNVACVSTLKL